MQPTQIKTVIAGVDGSERSADALALAHALAARLGTEPKAVFVQRERDGLDRPGIEPEVTLVADRSPSRGLEQAAADHGPALVVLGASRRSGLGRVFPGSTAQRLLAAGAFPVAIAPRGYAGEPRALDTIASAFDGSPESRTALAWSKELARASGGRVVVVAVHQPLASAAPAFQTVPMMAQDDVVREYVARRASETARAIELDGVEAHPRVLTGDVETLLVGETERADLMVTGSRGLGPARAALLGTVSGALVYRAASPVLVLPRGTDADAAWEEAVVAAHSSSGGR